MCGFGIRSICALSLAVAAGVSLSTSGCGSSSTPAVKQFVATGSMVTARQGHTATLLGNGKVLVAGGAPQSTASPFASAELYDPATGTFTATGSLAAGRDFHAATLLSNGKVLITGGLDATGAIIASAEIYDPATGTCTSTGSMITARAAHTATQLSTGKVLIAGGAVGTANTQPGTDSAELYDPATGKFTATGSLGTARVWHSATPLGNEKVLIAGGGIAVMAPNDLASAELYDLASGTFTATGSMTTARSSHAAALLANGQVLVAGGQLTPPPNWTATASGEVYDPASGKFTTVGNLSASGNSQVATLLPSGLVLVTGGQVSTGESANADLYDPATGRFTPTGNLLTARVGHTATLLGDGKVLVVGGISSNVVLSSAELY
jgi:hypothetical protein